MHIDKSGKLERYPEILYGEKKEVECLSQWRKKPCSCSGLTKRATVNSFKHRLLYLLKIQVYCCWGLSCKYLYSINISKDQILQIVYSSALVMILVSKIKVARFESKLFCHKKHLHQHVILQKLYIRVQYFPYTPVILNIFIIK